MITTIAEVITDLIALVTAASIIITFTIKVSVIVTTTIPTIIIVLIAAFIITIVTPALASNASNNNPYIVINLAAPLVRTAKKPADERRR